MPGLATLPDSLLVGISSPYKRSGLLFEKWRAHFGKDDDRVLVINAASQQLNPTLNFEEIEAYRELDPEAAKSEWDGQFRDDVQNFVGRESVEACTTIGVYEIAPIPGVEYRAFVDPAGGSGLDSMTLAVSRCESNGVAVLDAVRERKPQFSPDDCVAEFAQLLRAYRVSEVVGDRWGGSFVSESFNARDRLPRQRADQDRTLSRISEFAEQPQGRASRPSEDDCAVADPGAQDGARGKRFD